jgi:NADH-quinone oxidoreductase subunit J
MSASTVIFYLLAILTAGGAILSVTSAKIFRAAVYLLFSLIGIAGIYFYLNYEFLGAVQIVVYVGGIIVLIIFSIFLTAESGSDMRAAALSRKIFAGLAAVLGLILALLFIKEQTFNKQITEVVEPTVRNIGAQMLSTEKHGYILPFEAVSILLLAAMIGCIVIAIKPGKKV